MAHLQPTQARSTTRQREAGRAPSWLGWVALAVLIADALPRRVRRCRREAGRFLLGWLGLAVLIADAVVRRVRAARRDAYPRMTPRRVGKWLVVQGFSPDIKAWRAGVGWATGACAVAGVGLLLSALTAQPPRPPEPGPQAMPPRSAAHEAPGLKRVVPTRIEIPAIGVDAELLSLGVDDKDELAVPPLDRAELASWYNLGPSPGEPGSAVVVGHVDSQKIGPAVFFNLGKLKPGDAIVVTREDGTKPRFKVDSVQMFLKTSFPTQLVYDGERPALRVITCGGEFDRNTRSYLSSVVVFASLTDR